MRAKLECRAIDYKWSSAIAHVDNKETDDILDMKYWRKLVGIDNWGELLIRSEDEHMVAGLRSHTMRGRPLGNYSVISKLETVLGRRVRALPVGRPRKQLKSLKDKDNNR